MNRYSRDALMQGVPLFYLIMGNFGAAALGPDGMNHRIIDLEKLRGWNYGK